LEISDDKVTISSKQKKFWSFFQQLLTKFLIEEDLHVAFLIAEKGPRAAKISWRAAFWPYLLL